LRVGIVTLLFTDLVGSSQLRGELGDDAADRVLRGHLRLLREQVDRFRGQEVKSLGDGVMAVFPSALDAARCAIAMQQAVRADNRDGGPSLRLRIGIHTGEPVTENDDYFGQPVIVAKRLCDRAEGGQIVVSDLFESIVGSRGGFEFADLGWLALKGVGTPVPGRALVWEAAPDEVRSHPAAEPPAGGRERPGRAMGAIAAIAAVAVLGALWGGGFLGGDPGVSGDLGGSEAIGGVRLRWQRADAESAGFEGPGDQRINRLHAAGRGLVAVGQDSSRGRLDAAAWTSEDGIRWSRAAPAELHRPGGQAMTAVTGGRRGLVAVGWSSSSGDMDAAVWTSSDGSSWKGVAGAEELGGVGDQVMNRVAPGGPGLIAVGYEDAGEGRDGAIWTSSDGLSWDRVRSADAILGGIGNQEVRSLAGSGDRLVAVGYDDARGDLDAAAWSSRGGRRWRRVPHAARVFGGPGEQYMNAVTAHRSGFVAVGWDTVHTSLDAAAWTSSDGTAWERVPQDEVEFGGQGRQLMYGVDSGGSGLVAVGRDTSGGGSDAAVWFSEDGVTWARSPGDEEILGGDRAQEMRWVAFLGDRLVGAGWDRKGGLGEDAAVWWTRPP
jgi:class 3 adenylate cyclase